MVAGCTLKRLIVISSRDAEFCLSNQHILAVAGYTTELSSTFEEIMLIAQEHIVRGVLVDARDASAVQMCEELRKGKLTAGTKIVGLLRARAATVYPAFIKAGIDEVFVCPVEPQRYLDAFSHLLADEDGEDASFSIVSTDGLSIDCAHHTVSWQGRGFHLGLIEFRILHLLMSARGKVLHRRQLISGSWPAGIFVDPRTVNVHVARLRAALKAVTGIDRIRTVRGVGYALATPRPSTVVVVEQPAGRD